jgi:HSP20 family protein
MNLIRYNEPFQGLLSDPLFEGFLSNFATPQRQWSIRMEVAETPEAYLVKAELPGFSREQISVDVHENMLTIAAEIQPPKQENVKWLFSDRQYGKTTRSIQLPDAVQADAAEAKYVDGVLYLTLPKAENARVKRLTVH